jgi:hypothetical protein
MTGTEKPFRGIQIAKSEGWIFVALIVGVVLIGEGLKVFRAPALLLIIAVALVYARGTLLRKQHLPLLLFSAWGMIYVLLSYVNALPTAWTRYHETSAILQQASFLAVLLPVVAASQKWWDDRRFDENREIIMIAIVIAAFCVGAVFDMVILHFDGTRPLVTLRNYVLIGLMALTYLAFRSTKWRTIAIVILLMLAAWSAARIYFLQNTLVYVILIGFLVPVVLRLPVDRLMLGTFLVLLAGATIYGLQDPLRVFSIDANTGWRLAWWNDVLVATGQTGGIGVGFGTESLRNEYTAILERDAYREEGGSFLLVSTHSAFFDTTFRLGFVGVFLLVLALIRCLPPKEMNLATRAHVCAVFAIMILCLHSNLGLQSPMYSLGVAFCIGYFQSERRKALASSRADADMYLTPQPSYAASYGRH